MTFEEFFQKATDRPPYKYQTRLAMSSAVPDVLVGPTGIGKTAAIVLQWVWRSIYADEETRQSTPRRLVYCLPQRTLVEQTLREVEGWLIALDLLTSQEGEQAQQATDNRISLHVLMGGDVDNTWESYPERRTILIGTQDQLLSRALNRGFGISKYKWPVHFSLLNVDALWVCDELQLMDIGLKTSAQLQAFRWKSDFAGIDQTHTIWTSATFQPKWLDTVDFRQSRPDLDVFSLNEEETSEPGIQKIVEAQKTHVQAPFRLDKDGAKKNAAIYVDKLANYIVEQHQTGTMTLVIINRVNRAQAVYEAILKKQVSKKCILIHSRFRAKQRANQLTKLQSSETTDCVIVATQAIEAGVDISARTLITELAPWPSLVQRFGRCNRRGEALSDARVTTIDLEDDKELALPYTSESLQRSREHLKSLVDVSSVRLPEVDDLKTDGLVLRYRDLLDLFDTSADLSGADVDVSKYIRNNRDVDVQVYWRNVQAGVPTPDLRDFGREELCPVSIGIIRDYMKKEHKNLSRRTAWVWDSLDGMFQSVAPQDIYPGQILLLDSKLGGYTDERGFVVDSWEAVQELSHPISDVVASNKPDNTDTADPDSSIVHDVTIAMHLHDVWREAAELVNRLPGDYPTEAVLEAALYHDCGKALEAFQEKLGNQQTPAQLLAKSSKAASTAVSAHANESRDKQKRQERQGLRHELASALAYFEYAKSSEQPGNSMELTAYLIAAHHGKVRTSIRSLPIESGPDAFDVSTRAPTLFARGVWHGDRLPSIEMKNGRALPAVRLDLRPMKMGFVEGDRQSWTAMALQLLNTYGPFQLAWLETLVRVADWRASAKEASQ